VKTGARNSLFEKGLIGLILALCALCAVLQWRWTGEVARAETARMQGNLDEQAQRMARAFDAELAAACEQLVPKRAELNKGGAEAVYLARLRAWMETKPAPIFSKIACAMPGESGVNLTMLDPKTLAARSTEWPAEWKELRDNLARKRMGGSPPFMDRQGVLFEIPYARETWLPALVREHLNFDDKPLCDVIVKSRTAQIFASPAGIPENRDQPVTVAFNRQGRDANDDRRRIGPGGPDGPGAPGGVRDGMWTLQVWRHPGALEAIVARARWRNLALAGVVNVLLLGAVLLLVWHTRRARALAEAQMNFVAGVTHELRTPLTVIRGAAHNLERGIASGPERVGEYAALIGAHAAQLGDMVEQVLGFAGAAKNLGPSTMRPVVLGEVLREAATAAEPETNAARCRLELDIPAELPSAIGDAAMLRRAFQNLIANAAKHGGAGGWIGVSAGLANGHSPPALEVRVADRGRGIPPGEQAEIFKPFVRGAAAQEAQIRGSGIGLSLVREIVEAHHGSIFVCSEAGCGAAFIVRLPADAAV
jgi:signal transduction histidine kinase